MPAILAPLWVLSLGTVVLLRKNYGQKSGQGYLSMSVCWLLLSATTTVGSSVNVKGNKVLNQRVLNVPEMMTAHGQQQHGVGMASDWGSQTPAQPIKYNYHILPDSSPSHGWSSGGQEMHGHGWKGMEGEKDKDKDDHDGLDLIKSIVGIKALKLGKYFILGKLLTLLLILGAISKAGTVFAPVTLPLFALPIAVIAAILFKPLLFLGFIVVGLVSVLKDEGKKKKGHKMQQGWGWMMTPHSQQQQHDGWSYHDVKSNHRYGRYKRRVNDTANSGHDLSSEEFLANILSQLEAFPFLKNLEKRYDQSWSAFY